MSLESKTQLFGMCHACSIHLTAMFILLSSGHFHLWRLSSIWYFCWRSYMFQQMFWIEVLLWKLCWIVQVWLTTCCHYCRALFVKFLVISGNRGLVRCFEVFFAKLCNLWNDKICIAELETHYLNNIINIVRMCVEVHAFSVQFLCAKCILWNYSYKIWEFNFWVFAHLPGE